MYSITSHSVWFITPKGEISFLNTGLFLAMDRLYESYHVALFAWLPRSPKTNV